MLNPEGRLELGDLILEGICATCGGQVVRLVETGEERVPKRSRGWL